jgi:hypothetical protein
MSASSIPYKIWLEHLKNVCHATYDPLSSLLDPKSDDFASDADNLAEALMPYGPALGARLTEGAVIFRQPALFAAFCTASGTSTLMLVPCPGLLRISALPPTRRARS